MSATVFDGQQNFDGGMNSLVEPFRVPDGSYVQSKNMEFRGKAKTRRGSTRLATDSGGLGFSEPEEVRETFMYREPDGGRTTQLVIQGTTLYYFDTLTWQRDYLTLPGTMPEASDYCIVQAYNDVYFFFGDNLDVWKWDGDRTNALTVATDVPGGHYAFYAYNRLWVVTNNDTVNASDALSDNFDLVNNSIKVDFGDGSKVTAGLPFLEGFVVIFKEEGVAIISGANSFTDSNDLSLQWIDRENGNIARDSVVQVGADIIYLSNGDVRSIRQTQYSKAQSTEVTLTREIPELMGRINWEAAPGAEGVLFDNYYLLAIPFDEAQDNNTILAFDLLTRKWVSHWQYTDANSSEDDGLWRHVGMAVDRQASKDELITVNRDGGVARLLDSETEDFVHSSMYGYQTLQFEKIDFSVTSSPVTTFLQLDDTGMIEFWFSVPNSGAVAIAYAFNYTNASSDHLRVVYGWDATNIYVTVDFKGSSGTWDQTLKIDKEQYDFSSDRIFKCKVIQDGLTSTEKIFLEGVRDYTITDTNPGSNDLWFSDQTYYPGVFDGEINWNLSPGSNEKTNLYLLSVYGGGGSSEILLNFPLNEGTGTTVDGYRRNGLGDIEDVADGTLDGGLWVTHHIAPSPIVSRLLTRGMTFQGEHDIKKIVRGDITLGHQQPSLSVDMLTNVPFETFSLVSGKTYSLTEYDIHGVDDWVATNANDDFETPYRQDYAPVDLGTTGVDTGVNGFTVDKDCEHTVRFATIATAPWVQLDIQSSTGWINIKSLALEGRVSRPFADNRSKE